MENGLNATRNWISLENIWRQKITMQYGEAVEHNLIDSTAMEKLKLFPCSLLGFNRVFLLCLHIFCYTLLCYSELFSAML